MDETQLRQLNTLNQKVVDGETLTSLQEKVRDELTRLQMELGNGLLYIFKTLYHYNLIFFR